MQVGRRNKRITVEYLSPTQDSVGQPVLDWLVLDTMSASIQMNNGVQVLRSGADTSLVRGSIRVRYRTDITPGMRVRLGLRIFDIKAVIPEERKLRDLDLVVEEVT